MKKWILPILTIFLFSSCMIMKADTADQPGLLNKKWVLSAWGNSSSEIPKTMKEVFIQFNEKQVNGQSGCNNYFGGYQMKGDKLSFEKLGSTMMACGEESMVVERQFHDMLEKVTNYKIQQGVLSFYAGKEIIAQFK